MIIMLVCILTKQAVVKGNTCRLRTTWRKSLSKKKKKTHGEKDCWKVQTPNITLTHLFIIYYYMKFDKILSLI